MSTLAYYKCPSPSLGKVMILTNARAFIRAFTVLLRKGPNTKTAEFANTVDPDEMAHELSHLIRIYSVCPLVFHF